MARKTIVRVCNSIKTRYNLLRNAGKSGRKLEIGPGKEQIPGFETIDIVNRANVDYVWDVASQLPFKDDTFEVIYASHILEHIPWFQTEKVLQEWMRVLVPQGRLEIWVPDGLKICQVIVDCSLGVENLTYQDGWVVHNPRQDPFMWANGRLFWGARTNYPSWHKAVFTAKSLTGLLDVVGFTSVRLLELEENRGNFHHGWINLGVVGIKP